MRQRTPRETRGWRRLALALIAGVVWTAPAWAEQDEEPGDYEAPGFYLTAMAAWGLPTLQADIRDDFEDTFGTRRTSIEGSWGLNARAGYRIIPRLAVEAQFEWLPQFEIEGRLPGNVKLESDVNIINTTANAKGYLLTDRIQPYLLGGVGWMRVQPKLRGDFPTQRTEASDFVMRFGAGADLYASRDVAFSVETSYLVAPTGQIKDFDYFSVSAGLTLRFYGLD